MLSNQKFALLMAMVVAATPFAVDAYLPGFPHMAADFSAAPSEVAKTISLFVVGLALGQLVGGPLGDRFGRRYLIIAGFVVFALSSLAIAWAENISSVFVFRFIQALGGGFAVVCVPPLIRARAQGNEAAKLFSLIGIIMVAAPALAPSVGSLLIYMADWRSIFIFLALYVTLAAILIAVFLPDDWRAGYDSLTVAANVKASVAPLRIWLGYRTVLKNYSAMGYLLSQGLVFSVMLVFVTNASFIYQDFYGLSERDFALLFAGNILMMAVMNRYNNRKLNTLASETLLLRGLNVQLSAVAILAVLSVVGAPVFWVAPVIILSVGAHGIIAPNANAIYISHFKEHTGVASALMGAGQFLMAGICGGLSTQLQGASLWPLMMVMLALSLLANVLARVVSRHVCRSHRTDGLTKTA